MMNDFFRKFLSRHVRNKTVNNEYIEKRNRNERLTIQITPNLVVSVDSSLLVDNYKNTLTTDMRPTGALNIPAKPRAKRSKGQVELGHFLDSDEQDTFLRGQI